MAEYEVFFIEDKYPSIVITEGEFNNIVNSNKDFITISDTMFNIRIISKIEKIKY